MRGTVVVFSTYVDEIPLASGGLIANHAEAGDRVIVVAMCYPGYPSKLVYPGVDKDNPYGCFRTKEEYISQVASKEVSDIAAVLGIEKIITWTYQGNMDQLFGMDVVDRMHDIINEYEPDIVATHWPVGDYTDFIGAGTSVMRVLIERRVKKMPQVYFSETLTGRHTLCFIPNTYVDISRTIHKKKAACEKVWQGQCVKYFFNPFALPIAHFRGRESGVAFAEAYVALHGSFGLEKKPGIPRAPGAHPVTMQRAVELLERNEFADGVVPTYGAFDDETAKNAFGV